MHSPGLCQVNYPLCDLIQRGGDVLQQQWPTVDPKYLVVPEFVELSVLVRTNTNHNYANYPPDPKHNSNPNLKILKLAFEVVRPNQNDLTFKNVLTLLEYFGTQYVAGTHTHRSRYICAPRAQ